MKCVRCHKEVDNSPYIKDAKEWGGMVYFTCPHCRKLYIATESIEYRPVEDPFLPLKKVDNYGNEYISNRNYYYKK